MNIFIVCSKNFYDRVFEIKQKLEQKGHCVSPPNSFDDPFQEDKIKQLSPKDYIDWKANMFNQDREKIEQNDAILVLNFHKNGQENYIGGATFLEMFKAFELKKKIFLMNPIPKNLLEDEIKGFNPIILNNNIDLLK